MIKDENRLNMEKVRQHFPILNKRIHGKPVIYFDNASTNHKPEVVLQASTDFYANYNANIHRGVHTLSNQATNAVEDTRQTIQKFINAAFWEEVIFTSGTTMSLNFIAHTYGKMVLQPGDEIVLSIMEHHANIIPWQIVAQETGAIIKYIPICSSGELNIDILSTLITDKTKIVAVVHVSNTLGVVNPIQALVQKAHKHNAVFIVDGAQAVSHFPIDVQDLDCDFYAFSAHKLYGPTGLGILYGKKKLLEKMPPYQGGGGMVDKVTMYKTTYYNIPFKFEAGTLNIAAIIAFKKSLDFVLSIGYAAIIQHENKLLDYAQAHLSQLPQVHIIGSTSKKTGVLSFTIPSIHHFDIGMLLDAQGIAVRTGHHCTQPLMQALCIDGTVRISFAVYNTLQEIELFYQAIKKIITKYAN